MCLCCYLFERLLLRCDHSVLCVLPHVLVDVHVGHLHVPSIGDELDTSAALLDAQVDVEGEVEGLQRLAAVHAALLRVHDELAEALVDDRVKEGEVMESDWSSKNILKKKNPRMFILACQMFFTLMT